MAITSAQTPIQLDDAAASAHTKSSISTTAGNRLVVAVMCHATSNGQVSSVTDSAGNTWSQVVSKDGTISGCAIWSTTNNAAAITSYTINLDSSATIQSTLFELTSTDTGVKDVSGSGTGSSTAISSGSSGIPSVANDVAIGVGGNGLIFADNTYSSVAFTTGGGTFQTRSARTSFLQCATGFVILSGGSTAAQTFSMTAANSSDWVAAVALFKAAPPAAGGPTFNNYQFMKSPNSGLWFGERIK